MNLHHRDFTVGSPAEREVSFSLAGTVFRCLPDITMSVMEDYRAGFVPDENDPTKVGISLELAVRLIESCLRSEEDIETFRKIRAGLSFDTGPDTIHAIREFLVESYSEAGPTTEPSLSLPGPPVSGPTPTDESGSQDSTPTPSPSAAT